MIDKLPWRQGRSLGRTLYIQRGESPSKADLFIGVMDTPALAAMVCAAVNECRDAALRVVTPDAWDEEQP